MQTISMNNIQAGPATVPSPENYFKNAGRPYPADLSVYCQPTHNTYGPGQLFNADEYLLSLYMALASQQQYYAPVNPLTASAYHHQLPPSNAHPAGASSGTHTLQPHSISFASTAGIPQQQWATAGPISPTANTIYRSYGQPRLRVAQACNGCRKRRCRCTGVYPCERCSRKGLVCKFDPERRVRGPNKQKNKSASPSPSSSGCSDISLVSSRQSSVDSLPDGKSEIDVIPAVIRRHHSRSSQSSSSGRKRETLRADSNPYPQQMSQLIQPMPFDTNTKPTMNQTCVDQMEMHPWMDVQRDNINLAVFPEPSAGDRACGLDFPLFDDDTHQLINEIFGTELY
ncbi:hypothetical protein NEOLEDRAFT_1239843 [Neolentinus lepideus HHB14362 ss-1]|uniref:Zn(2)-C6 fungal-type domain-containing protein n=1 Tax=Neolentinus lepideus HHB14362 ss-1 TaxID=1314782 RepID=A0A165UG18_9AGAM|nr:hypothetical protein NEOLEDRAFT_1239843 [Neolentinus lepideus HHB14362 ss-1]